MSWFAAERQASADQVRHPESQGGVEALNVLRASDHVQAAKND